MAEVIRMPKMSDTMTEGVIVAWNKKVGDEVKPGDILAEVETDKATMELENYVKGTLLHIGIEKGKAVPVDGIIAVVGQKGEDFSSLLDGGGATKEEPKAEDKEKATGSGDEKEEDQPEKKTEKEEPKKEEAKPSKESSAPEKKSIPAPPKPAATVQSTASAGNRVIASPLAKKIAQEKGVDISGVSGSGDNGRIIKRDMKIMCRAAAKKKSR